MTSTTAMVPATQSGVAFEYNGTEVLFKDGTSVNLTQMWQAAGSPSGKEPWEWRRHTDAVSFVRDLASNLNLSEAQVWKTSRGKNGGTWAHWQIAMAYAKHLSNEFHRFVNEAFREWAEEKANPDLKVQRAIAAYKRQGKSDAWISYRLQGIGYRKQMRATMADHNCKVRGKNDNPYAEMTRSHSLAASGKTPRELREAKGLPKSASTRDHQDEVYNATVGLMELLTARGIKEQGADGNEACLAVGRHVGQTVGHAVQSLRALG